MQFKKLLNPLLALIILVGIPVVFLAYQSKKTGKTWSQIIWKPTTADIESSQFSQHGEKIDFLIPKPIGNEFTEPPMISHLQVVDLNNDGFQDVVVCDVTQNSVTLVQQDSTGGFEETILADKILAPSHVQVIDFDQDGYLDLVVSLLGMLFPNNDKIGSVVILENDGQMNFVKHVAIEKVSRASDARAGDLDGDGDMDLATIHFGYDDGETRWLENLGNWKFKNHVIQTLSGGVNCELYDFDNDGDLDIVTIVSQEWEEIYLFVNDGRGNFQARLISGISNSDFGSSGISLEDLDQDNDMDILYTNGDAFDYIPPRPRPWHGVNWLENTGNSNFTFHRIANFGGAFNARPLDIENDGDKDIFVVSTFNQWEIPKSQSFIWLENDGDMNFERHDIANSPTHILPLEMGDFNNDGQIDFVTGGMHAYPPYDRMARVLLWYNNWSETTGDR
jgi:hypothetical protein